MFNKIISRRAAEFSVFFGLLCALFLSFAHFDAACEDLRENVLRLHIIANSDSREDQELKLAVRDRILAETSGVFEGKTDLKSAEKAVNKNLGRFREIANEVIKEKGFSYKASVRLGDSSFTTREYDEFTLPAGNYRSLIITLGEATGHNWWCVVFPAVCIPAASGASLSDSASDESAEIAEHPQKYVIKFKTVEIYEEIKSFFKK